VFTTYYGSAVLSWSLKHPLLAFWNWMQASSQTAMYTIAQRIQMQSGKLQMQQRECFLEDGGHNAAEQI
jgi:hypothetical protein